VSTFLKLECGVCHRHRIDIFYCYLFDDIIKNVVNLKSYCYVSRACLSIILNADDILLLAPSSESLQKLVTVCGRNLLHLMFINGIMRIGPRFNKHCANISIQDGQ